MSGFMTYLNKINLSLVEEVDTSVSDEAHIDESVVVETPKVIKKVIKKSVPQKVDKSVAILEERIRSKLDNIGLNSKLINEVVSFVLDDVSNIPNLKLSEGKQINNTIQQQPISVNEFKMNNDVRGAAEFLLEGVPETSSPGRVSSSSVGGSVNARMSNVADHASSLL